MSSVATLAKITGRIKDMERESIDKDLFALLYGSYGTGKTTLVQGIAQAIKGDGRILYLDSSQGWVSLDNIPKLKRSTDRLQVSDPRELMVIADALKNRKKGFENYRVLVMDEVDSWFEVILHSYVREATGTLPSQDLPEIEGKHYAAPTQAFLNIVNTLYAAEGLHIIMVAHEQERGKDNRTMLSPSLPPKLMKGLNEKVHVVARLESIIARDGYVREIQVNPSKQVVAKSRIGGLPVKIDFKDMPKILKNWVGSTQMEEDLIEPEVDPDLVDDADVETEEVETWDETEAVEVED